MSLPGLEDLIRQFNKNGEGALEEYRRLAEEHKKAFAGILFCGFIFPLLVGLLAYFTCIESDLRYYFLIIGISTGLFSLYFAFKILKILNKFFKSKEKYWLPPLNKALFQFKSINILFFINGIVSAVVVIYLIYLFEAPIIMGTFAILFLVFPPLLPYLQKYSTKKEGYSIGRKFKVSVDKLADTVSMLTGAEKKSIGGSGYQQYIFDLPHYNLKIIVMKSVQEANSSFVSILNIKDENVSYAVGIARKIEESLAEH